MYEKKFWRCCFLTKEQILNSVALKKRFAKDSNLPISVFDNPYFEYQLNLIDKYEPCVAKFNRFCDELERFENEQEYFEYYNAVKDEIITYIQNTPQYKNFNDDKCYSFDTKKKYPNRDVYKEDNLGKYLISLDMKEANFTALNFFEPLIFNRCSTWGMFISTFTNMLHIIGSKYIRQVILGACNPGRQIKAETVIMTTLAENLEDKFNCHIISVAADEIIIEGTFGSEFDVILSYLQEQNMLGMIKLEQFSLQKLNGKTGWVKHISRSSNCNPVCDSRKKLKCVSSVNFCQVLKYMLDLPIEENDLVFHYEGSLCRFLEPMPNPFDMSSI